jgi:hypothetical protein
LILKLLFIPLFKLTKRFEFNFNPFLLFYEIRNKLVRNFPMFVVETNKQKEKHFDKQKKKIQFLPPQ